MALSVPAEYHGAPRARDASPRRKLDVAFGGAVVGGTGVSPNAKRPNQYVVPDPAMGPKLTIETLSAGLYTTKAAVQNMHNWIGSIAEAVSGHADQLEEASSDFTRMRAELIAYEQKMADGLQGDEAKNGETLAKVDSLVGQLRQDTTTAAAELAAKTVQLEAGLANLQSANPTSLTQNTGGEGTPDAAVLSSAVQVLTQSVKAANGRFTTIGDELRSLKTTGGDCERHIGGLKEC